MYAKQIFQIKDIDSADQNRATADIKSQKDKINEDIYKRHMPILQNYYNISWARQLNKQ